MREINGRVDGKYGRWRGIGGWTLKEGADSTGGMLPHDGGFPATGGWAGTVGALSACHHIFQFLIVGRVLGGRRYQGRYGMHASDGVRVQLRYTSLVPVPWKAHRLGWHTVVTVVRERQTGVAFAVTISGTGTAVVER